VTEDELRQICVQFGELIYVKVPVGKGCGFVQYASRYVLKWKKVYSIV
jgi:RNA recognition motif-containing protein